MKRSGVAGIAVLCLTFTATLSGQSVRSLINGGNNHYKDEKYADAEAKYSKAL